MSLAYLPLLVQDNFTNYGVRMNGSSKLMIEFHNPDIDIYTGSDSDGMKMPNCIEDIS